MPPGVRFSYNDVRVNLLAKALTLVWERSLEDVLNNELFAGIGGSGTAEWHGYRASYVDIGGRRVQCVSGGGHWGGGLWANAMDHFRFGQLYLDRGKCGDDRILSDAWVTASFSQGAANPDYGLLWWLNAQGRVVPGAPTTGVCARGNAGRQLIWVDPALDLVVVSRWTDHVGRFLRRLSGTLVQDC